MKDRAMNLRLALAAAAGLLPAPALVSAASMAALAGAASAQTLPTATEPFYVIITQDQAPLLAGAVETHYRVALLPIGTILKTDHTLEGWALVEYPAGASAYIRATEATLAPDGRTLRTNAPTRLRAANMESTSVGSWATLLVDPVPALPAGTELRVLGVENRADGTPNFYKVAAPASARGFLRNGLYRTANPQETQDHLNRIAMGGQPGASPASTPAATPAQNPAQNPAQPAATPTNPATNPTTPPANQPTQAPESTSPAQPSTGTPAAAPSGGVDTSLLAEPIVPTSTDRPAGAPATSNASAPLVIDQSGTITGGDSGIEPPAADPLSLTPEGLEAAFEEIRRLPFEEGEYEELIARFEQVINTLGDTPADQRTRAGLELRADVLRLRRDYRDSLRSLDEGQSEARQLAARASERIDWLRTQGGYAVVGRLVASNIYDGSSGPLMYRVVAVNTDVPRTLAYVRMDDQFTLPALIGKVVGVRGQVTIEPAIGTRIVEAESVDTVEVPN